MLLLFFARFGSLAERAEQDSLCSRRMLLLFFAHKKYTQRQTLDLKPVVR
jgi:hypothetical protein